MVKNSPIVAGACILAGSGLSVSVAAVENKEFLRIEPSSNWNLNYADDSCRIARKFGEGDQKVVLYIEKYEPGDVFTMVAAGAPLKTRRDYAFVQFGANEAEQKYTVTLGNLGEIEPALIFTSVQFAATLPEQEAASASRNAVENDVFGQTLSAGRETAIEWVRIGVPRRKPVYLATGSLGKPMEAMRTCTGDLLTRWGVDLEKHRNLANMPKPRSNPERWLTSADYPSDLLRKGSQGIVNFRLSVDATGNPTQCHIQQSTRPEGFDSAVCRALMKRARFEPAMTAEGEAIASFWRSTVRFQVGR
ncbi:energy transducer TonB [Pontixanthobacter sp.]|uniref:energy transducer TonB n=1 Tax=Pontixanthobacter sp. TaxID=2792078 RepID=UPI003C7DC146